jgi:hypothetical protein
MPAAEVVITMAGSRSPAGNERRASRRESSSASRLASEPPMIDRSAAAAAGDVAVGRGGLAIRSVRTNSRSPTSHSLE